MRQNFRIPFVLLTVCSLLSTASTLFAQQGKRPDPSAKNSQPTGKATLSNSAVPTKSAADNSQASPTAEKRPRPAPQDLEKDPEIDKLDPKLEKILIDWEAHSSKIKSLQGKHIRKEFIKTFAVEKVSEGQFFLETPDKGRIDMIAKPIAKGAVPRSVGFVRGKKSLRLTKTTRLIAVRFFRLPCEAKTLSTVRFHSCSA